MFFKIGITLCLLELVFGHTWIDALFLVDANDQAIGNPGFIRGYVQRLPGFTDEDVNYLLPIPPETTFQDSDPMCKSTQTKGNQTNGPILLAPGGSRVVLLYLENGHISEPWIKPQKPSPGLVSVYATSQSEDDDKFTAIHGQWTDDGLGGDKRGYLMNLTTFDDGQCFQENYSEISRQRNITFGPGNLPAEAPNRLCRTLVTMNDESGQALPSGTLLTLYWIWDWPSCIPGDSGDPPTFFNESYTSCMDIMIQ